MAASPSQTLSTFVIPSSERTDPEPVKSSLSLAHAELTRGDTREALRHLRRAAEGADEAGSELRAVALARAAADLATEVGSSVAPPPVREAPVPLREAPSAMPVSMVRGNADGALRQLLETGRAVKVAVKRSARDENLFVVRRADGSTHALGTREAIIVLLEPDEAFFAPAAAPKEE
jgi:hypothetical protein